MHTSHVSALSWTILTLQASESLKKSLRDFGSHPLRIPRVVLFGVIIFDRVLYQRVKEELSQGVGHIQEGTALCSKAPVGRNSGKNRLQKAGLGFSLPRRRSSARGTAVDWRSLAWVPKSRKVAQLRSLARRSIEGASRRPGKRAGGKMAATAAGGLPGKGHDISLAALQRHDPYISRIVDVASQVALYTFFHRANKWVRADAANTRTAGRGRGGGCWARLGGRGARSWRRAVGPTHRQVGKTNPEGVAGAAASPALVSRPEDRSARAAEGRAEPRASLMGRSQGQKSRAGTHLRARSLREIKRNWECMGRSRL